MFPAGLYRRCLTKCKQIKVWVSVIDCTTVTISHILPSCDHQWLSHHPVTVIQSAYCHTVSLLSHSQLTVTRSQSHSQHIVTQPADCHTVTVTQSAYCHTVSWLSHCHSHTVSLLSHSQLTVTLTQSHSRLTVTGNMQVTTGGICICFLYRKVRWSRYNINNKTQQSKLPLAYCLLTS